MNNLKGFNGAASQSSAHLKEQLHAYFERVPKNFSFVGPLIAALTANEVQSTYGRFTHGHFTALATLAAPHVILTGQATAPQSGFTLYNITDGIVTDDLAGWFTRWLSNPNLELSWASTTVKAAVKTKEKAAVKTKEKAAVKTKEESTSVTKAEPKTSPRKNGSADGVREPGSFLVAAIFGAFLVLIGAAAPRLDSVPAALHIYATLAMMMIPFQANASCEKAINKAIKATSTPPKAIKNTLNDEMVKVLVKFPTGRIVRLDVTRGMLFVLLDQKQPEVIPTGNATAVAIYKTLAWLLIAIQSLALGFAGPVYQITFFAVAMLVNLLAHKGIGETSTIGNSKLQLTTHRQAGNDSNRDAYVRLQLTRTEEMRMRAWCLFPTANEGWESRYMDSKFAYAEVDNEVEVAAFDAKMKEAMEEEEKAEEAERKAEGKKGSVFGGEKDGASSSKK